MVQKHRPSIEKEVLYDSCANGPLVAVRDAFLLSCCVGPISCLLGTASTCNKSPKDFSTRMTPCLLSRFHIIVQTPHKAGITALLLDRSKFTSKPHGCPFIDEIALAKQLISKCDSIPFSTCPVLSPLVFQYMVPPPSVAVD